MIFARIIVEKEEVEPPMSRPGSLRPRIILSISPRGPLASEYGFEPFPNRDHDDGDHVLYELHDPSCRPPKSILRILADLTGAADEALGSCCLMLRF